MNYDTTERKEYIEKLEHQIYAIEKILKMDSGTVLSNDVKKQLRNLKEDGQIALKKLKDDEFEIAIVGLEKAGKSTFANALIENAILPTKDIRCTFTSTRIEYCGIAKDDSAEVTFYTTAEFDSDFKDKLTKLGFSNPEKYSFDTMTLDTYEKYYEDEVSEERKKAYSDTIHEDIKSIIKNAPSLAELLDKPSRLFGSADIDGTEGESSELSLYITDEAKARAVKQVVIRSKKLENMKNAIIFDVPGFNSPTELHKTQTKERMKSADAIVVVASGISPSLPGESLKILRESDDEGNPLSDKLFVFANKIEGARSIPQNIEDTYSEWISRRFISDSTKNRVIFGSALAHLQAAGIDKDDRVLRQFKERESELPDGDGIDAIRRALEKYNHNERFQILKRRINRIQADIEKIFTDVRKENNFDGNFESFSADQMKLAADFSRNTIERADHNLKMLRNRVKADIPTDSPLSRQILEYIDSKVNADFCSISDEQIENASLDNLSVSTFTDLSEVERKVRDAKFQEMYDDFSANVTSIADCHHVDCADKILKAILEAMNADSSPYYNTIVDSLKQELSPYRKEFLPNGDTSALYYQSLIERYSRDLYEVLILSKYGPERLEKFYLRLSNFFSLSVFYKAIADEQDLSYTETALKDQPLVKMLLFHDAAEAMHEGNNDDGTLLISLLGKISAISEIERFPKETEELARKALQISDNQMDAVAEKIQEVFDRKVGIRIDDNRRIELLNNTLRFIVEGELECTRTESDATRAQSPVKPMFNIIDKQSFSRSYAEYHINRMDGKPYTPKILREDFEKDVIVLHDILRNAFVRAIDMETPFVAREVKSIDDIIQFIHSEEFSHYLIDNFRMVKYHENASLDKKQREKVQNNAIMNEIDSILNNEASSK